MLGMCVRYVCVGCVCVCVLHVSTLGMYVLNVSVCVLLGVCVCCSVCVKTRGQSKAVCLRFLFVFLLFGVCVHFYVLSLACLPEVQNESLPYCSLYLVFF